MLLLTLAYAADLQPGADLQAAVTAAAPGEVITLAAGDYSGHVRLNGKSVSFDGHGATLSGSITADLGESLVIRGLTIRDGAPAVKQVGGTLNLEGVTLAHNGASHVWGGALYASQASVVVEDSHFERNEGLAGGHAYLSLGTARFTDVEFETGLAGEGGAIRADGGSVAIEGGVFSLNSADGFGGAVYVTNGRLDVDGTLFSDNDVEDYGGALALVDSEAGLFDAEFEDNSSYDGYGGAVYVLRSTARFEGGGFYDNLGTYAYGAALWGQDASDVQFIDTWFEGNHAYRSGGAISWYYAYGTLELTGCTFIGNRSQYGHGGAIFSYVWGDIVATDTVFENNRALYHGGALYNYYYGKTTLTDVAFVGNRSDVYSGGGAYFYYLLGEGGVWMNRVRFEGNEAVLEGGGVFSRYLDTLSLDEVVMYGNEGERGLYGGGLFAQYNNTTRVHDSLFMANHASYGGGFYEDAGVVDSTWTNTVIQENTAVVGGGGCFSAQTTSFHNNNLVGNAATEGGGALCLFQATVDLRNSVVAWTDGSAAIEAFDDETPLLSGFNYLSAWENTEGDVGGTLTSLGTGITSRDPLLGSVSLDGQLNDSPVPSPGSPLVDAGDPQLLDPDGGPSDIGAHAGPYAAWADEDGDGFWSLEDCDDGDPSVFPGADDVWYDGINSDCGTGSDYDADGDGVDSVDFDGTDCDDTDDSVVDCPEDAGVDEKPEPEPEDPEGCSTAPAGGLLLALAGVLLRR